MLLRFGCNLKITGMIKGICVGMETRRVYERDEFCNGNVVERFRPYGYEETYSALFIIFII